MFSTSYKSSLPTSPRTEVCIENSSLFLDLRPNSHISMILISNKQDLLKCTLLMKGQVNYYTCCFALAKDFKCLPSFDSKNKQKPSEAEPLFIYCICVHPSLFVLLTRSVCLPTLSDSAARRFLTDYEKGPQRKSII